MIPEDMEGTHNSGVSQNLNTVTEECRVTGIQWLLPFQPPEYGSAYIELVTFGNGLKKKICCENIFKAFLNKLLSLSKKGLGF